MEFFQKLFNRLIGLVAVVLGFTLTFGRAGFPFNFVGIFLC
jgi:hypothetical protein